MFGLESDLVASALTQALLWYAAVAAGGVAATGCLRRVGLGSGTSWAMARLIGWTLAGYAAWLAGWAGVESWWWLGLPVVVGLLAWGWRGWRAAEPRMFIEPELVGVAAFVLLAFLRLPGLAITGTEKPMDLAILATLLRPGTIPPVDPWLAGHALPYYYWGFVPWLIPAKICGFSPDVVYNLLVPTLAAVSAQAAWALARALGGSRRTGVMAAFLVVFAGTIDGWRQLLAGVGPGRLDLWTSSRVIKGAITEFPLFTFQLGDLHPHLLCIPFVLAAVLLARVVGKARQQVWAIAGVGALAYGAAAAANPWCALPLGMAVWLVAMADETAFVTFSGAGRRRWGTVAALGIAGAMLYAPFWFNFHPPVQGFGWVTSATRVDELVLFLGALLVPPCLVAWELSWRFGGADPTRRHLTRAGWLAGAVFLAAASHRPALGLSVAVGALLVVAVVEGKTRPARPVFAMATVGLALVAVVEVIYFRDPYGAEYYRMNTVFKATSLAQVFLAVAAPVLLGWLRRRRAALAAFGAFVVIAAGLPQLASLGLRALASPVTGWTGLRWMAPGEAAAARFLRHLPSGSVLIEGVGDAYSDAARMSSASGVPAVLGWENHESVWRGAALGDEAELRKAQVARLYRCGDPAEVRRIARELGAGYVVVGGVERRLYGNGGLDAVRQAGQTVFRAGGCIVVAVGS
jgi:YYY domain-containing protein